MKYNTTLQTSIIFILLLAINSSGFGQNRSKEFILKLNRSVENVSAEFTVTKEPTNPFIGVSAYCLNARIEAELFYSIEVENVWQPWIPFREYKEGYTPDRKAFESEPIYADVQAIRFKSSKPIAEDIVFRLYFPQSHRLNPQDFKQNTNDSLVCDCPQPLICYRDCWSPDNSCPKDETPSPTIPTHLIIHHSAGHNNATDYAAVVSYYWDLHVNTNGWDDIGYNWLIDPNGVIYEGRGERTQGAHFSCMNEQTSGICIIGDFREVAPSTEAIEAIQRFAAWECCFNDIRIDGNSLHASSGLFLNHISAHRDGNNSDLGCSTTVCPGDEMYNRLPDLIAETASLACIHPDDNNFESLDAFHIYPNPNQGSFTLHIDFANNVGTYSLRIIDILGRQIYSYESKIAEQYMQLPLSIPQTGEGIYFVELRVSGQRYTSKMFCH